MALCPLGRRWRQRRPEPLVLCVSEARPGWRWSIAVSEQAERRDWGQGPRVLVLEGTGVVGGLCSCLWRARLPGEQEEWVPGSVGPASERGLLSAGLAMTGPGGLEWGWQGAQTPGPVIPGCMVASLGPQQGFLLSFSLPVPLLTSSLLPLPILQAPTVPKHPPRFPPASPEQGLSWGALVLSAAARWTHVSGRGPPKYFAFGVRPGAPVASVLPSPGLCYLGLPGQGLAPQGPSSALPQLLGGSAWGPVAALRLVKYTTSRCPAGTAHFTSWRT